jgi:predicted enzyme related to lactoylglutathione lyase
VTFRDSPVREMRIELNEPAGVHLQTEVFRVEFESDEFLELAEAAAEAAKAAGGEIAHPPMEIPGHGKFAIYVQGGVHHGLWQV